MLYDQQQDNLKEKTTFTHIVDVLKYYNNTYNPILKLKADEEDEASAKEYFCPKNHKAEYCLLKDIKKHGKNEKLECGKCLKPIDEYDNKLEFYRC